MSSSSHAVGSGDASKLVAPEGTRLLTEGKATIVYSEGREVFYNNVRHHNALPGWSSCGWGNGGGGGRATGEVGVCASASARARLVSLRRAGGRARPTTDVLPHSPLVLLASTVWCTNNDHSNLDLRRVFLACCLLDPPP